MDEYLKETISRSDCDSIRFIWKIYNDNDLVYYEPKPVTERFTNGITPDKTAMTKFIIKSETKIK